MNKLVYCFKKLLPTNQPIGDTGRITINSVKLNLHEDFIRLQCYLFKMLVTTYYLH